MNAAGKTLPPPPAGANADELLRYAAQLRAVAGAILARAGELAEVAEEMKGRTGYEP